MKSRGFGDSIEKITKATGLKTLTQIASSAMGIKDCGCDKRKTWLNNQFPYKYK
tara:strand:+ start:92 stop:253 length:162 start_codon:yes stop_codon:yes gene_type:complete